jgi:carbamoylphosphate synthase small subunit
MWDYPNPEDFRTATPKVRNAVEGTVAGFLGRGTGSVEPFDQILDGRARVTPETVGACTHLLIWGGEDISPSIYNKPVGPFTGAGPVPSERDKLEVAACKAAIERGIPIIGICRGAQLLCALAGGELVQDVSGHGRTHFVTTNDGRVLTTSSMHHQMMYPWDVEHELIAWSSEPRSRSYEGVDVEKMKAKDGSIIEPEIVFFPTINALAIQGHPEFMHANHEFVKYCNELVRKYLIKE